MASPAEKALYDKSVKIFKDKITSCQQRIDPLKKAIYSLKTKDHEYKIQKSIQITTAISEQIYYQVAVSLISNDILGIKNESYLDLARKNCYSAIQYWEELVGNEIDAPPSLKSDAMPFINEKLNNIERFEMMKKLGFAIDRIKYVYGEQSKWKWSFVELEGRFIVVVKNMIDFPLLIKNLDPSIPGYAKRMDIINILLDGIKTCSEQYRNKYELTNRSIEDMNKALEYVSYESRIAMLLGENDKAENLKKQHQIWHKKLQEDIKEAEKNT